MRAFVLFLVVFYQNQLSQSVTTVSIVKDQFYINGRPSNEGSQAEGLLLNSRMIQGIFDDSNPDTRYLWEYPDTKVWEPERNVGEFTGNFSIYRSYNLNAVTVGFQGGGPYYPQNGSYPWVVSGFGKDGSVNTPWFDRMKKVITRASEVGLVVIVSLFYVHEDHNLDDGDSVIYMAVSNVVDYLVGNNFTNVLLEIANESNNGFVHSLLWPANINKAITFAKQRSKGSLLVSTSFFGGVVPPTNSLEVADYITVHGNGLSPTEIRNLIFSIRNNTLYKSNPRPIIFNEDGTDVDKLVAAVSEKASWGFYDQGTGDYKSGFQTPPVNWGVSTNTKSKFFTLVKQYTNTI